MKKSLLTFIGLLGQLRFSHCSDYVVTNDGLTAVDGESETLVIFNNLEIIGRERYLNGSLIILDDLDDENYGFTVEMYTSPNGDGDYKKMAMNVPKIEVCEGFKKFYKEFIQPSFVYGENCNIPIVDDDGLCPIPAGEYYLKNIEFNTEAWPNQMPRGTLKPVITFYKGDNTIGGIMIELKIEDDTR